MRLVILFFWKRFISHGIRDDSSSFPFICRCIVVGHVNSPYSNINCEVPQGSGLGSILFALDANDISEALQRHFGLFCQESVAYQLCKNKIFVSLLQKTFDNCSSKSIIRNIPIRQVRCFKYLEASFDENSHWPEQVHDIWFWVGETAAALQPCSSHVFFLRSTWLSSSMLEPSLSFHSVSASAQPRWIRICAVKIAVVDLLDVQILNWSDIMVWHSWHVSTILVTSHWIVQSSKSQVRLRWRPGI